MFYRTSTLVTSLNRPSLTCSVHPLKNLDDILRLFNSEHMITYERWGHVSLNNLLLQRHTPSTTERVGYFPRLKLIGVDVVRAKQIKNNEGAIALLNQFLSDPSDYDLSVWEEVKSKIEEGRLSNRERFIDTSTNS